MTELSVHLQHGHCALETQFSQLRPGKDSGCWLWGEAEAAGTWRDESKWWLCCEN